MNQVNGYGWYHDYSDKGWRKSSNSNSSGKAERSDKGFKRDYKNQNLEKAEKSDYIPEKDQLELSDNAKEYLKELHNKEKSEESSETKQPELSEKAQALLKELQEKYQNVDFMIANYSSYEEAQQYLSKGTKEFSALIEPEVLEQMANDPATKEKYIALLEDSIDKLGNIVKELTEQLGDEAVNVKNIGLALKDNGEITYYTVLERSNKNLNAISEKGRAKRAEAKKAQKRADKKKSIKKNEEEKVEAKKVKKQEEEKKKIEKNKEEIAEAKKSEKREKAHEEATKTTYLEADSLSELLEKIRQVDWDKIQEPTTAVQVNHVNYTV